MSGEFQESFFHLSVKREHFDAFGFGGWSEFIQGEMAPDHYPVVLKTQVFPVQAMSPRICLG